MDEVKMLSLASDIFANAAAYIRKYGWQKEGMGKHGGPRCSMGALESAYPKINWNPQLAKLMYERLYKELNGISLTTFNDKYRNGEAVAKLFERTALKMRQNSQRYARIKVR